VELVCGGGRRAVAVDGLSLIVTGTVPFEAVLAEGNWILSDVVTFVAEIDAGSGFRAACVD
jgi:hypothetical protein